MKKFSSILLLILLLSLTIQALKAYHSKNKNQGSRALKGSYETAWLRVDSLEKKGLSKSALEVVNSIYVKAKAEKNTTHFIRALIVRMKFESYLEEDSYVKAIATLEKEANESEFPIQNILRSVAAETYWNYYQNNRFAFLNRTRTANFENNDIRTWDLSKLLEKVKLNYIQSLSNAALSKQSTLANYDALLIVEKGSKNFRPTLYDFLAHRAVDYFMNEEPEVSIAANAFQLNLPAYFSPLSNFSQLKIKLSDSLSMKAQALFILQDLIRFHASDKDPKALIDVDLKRLNYVHQHAVLDSKDSLYEDALKQLEQSFSASPAFTDVSYFLANFYWSRSVSQSAETNLIRNNDRILALQICSNAIAKFPESDGAKNCARIKSLLSEKSLSITLNDANLPGKEALALVKYKNVKKAYFKVVQLANRNDYDLDRGYSKEFQRTLLNQSNASNWSVDLPDDGDLFEHRVQVKIPKLDRGHYVIFVSSDATFSETKNGLAMANFWVSKISYVTHQTEDGSYVGYTLNREGGAPLKNVALQLWSEQYDYQSRKYNYEKGANYQSDENGYFTIPPTDNQHNFYIEFTSSDYDRFCSDNSFSQYKRYIPETTKYLQTYFFTDRKIYRPGQTVYFKALLLEHDGENSKLLVNQKTEVVFYDVNSQKISSLNLTSNEFGSVAGNFIAPQGLLNGQMYISNGSGSLYFSVEDYKRPKFGVSFNPLQGSYLLGDSVRVSGKSLAYSGAVIEGAKVNYRIVRQAIFPYWWGYWIGIQNNSPSMEIGNGITQTNEKGEFSISFKSIPDASIEKNNSTSFTYTVYADVTDISGETHSSEKSVNIGYVSLNLKTTLPAQLEKEKEQNFKVISANYNGDYEPASGTLKIYKLKQPSHNYRQRKWEKPDRFIIEKSEFEKLFPLDLYSDENNKLTWEKEEKVAEIAFNTDTLKGKKAGEFVLTNLKKWAQGEYVWEATTRDKHNQVVSAQDYFTLVSSQENTCASLDPLNVTLLNTSCEPGETAKILIGTREKSLSVLFEIERKDEKIKAEWLTLNEEQKILNIPVEEKDRGNIIVHFTYVKNNDGATKSEIIVVPYTNKELDITFQTFRNKLLPGQDEEWKITIKDKSGKNANAEFLATLYDASLDAFQENNWLLNLYQNYYSHYNWEMYSAFKINAASAYGKEWNVYLPGVNRSYDALNWFGFEGYSNFGYRGGRAEMYLSDAVSATAVPMQAPGMALAEGFSEQAATSKNFKTKQLNAATDKAEEKESSKNPLKTEPTVTSTKARKNFNETAFFAPQVQTDEQGNLVIKFTMPEALTKWKMLGLAHTRDLKIGSIEKELQTQKDLMVSLNAPRFLREGDKITFIAKVTNLSDRELAGSAQLKLFDALTMKEINTDVLKNQQSTPSFTVSKSQSTAVTWHLEIPQGIEAITYRVVANSGSFSDGEEMTLPVLSNRTLVTESLPLPINGSEAKQFTFSKLISQNNHSTTLSNYKVSLEFTTNPAWYAIQALPYLMEYPYECAEQTFSRYYANSLATHIAGSSPKIKAVFDAWKRAANEGNKESLLSNLEKNESLKSLLLEESPWVMQAKNESERKARLALLFDLTKMSSEQEMALKKLRKMQTPNGGWPWFEGMKDDPYITKYIVSGLGHLDHLGVKKIRENAENFSMIRSAVSYMDDRIREEYEWILKYDPTHLKENHLSYSSIQYLYARSYFKDIELKSSNKKAFDYFKNQAAQYWLKNSRYMQGMIALALNRYDNKSVATDIIKSLKENSIVNEELGMYWKENVGGYYWYEAPIETQALLIEAFDEVASDLKSVDKMKIWLLKNKQTNDWKTTKATSEACYALLLRGSDWLSTDVGVEITVGKNTLSPLKNPDLKTEAGTGYFKTSWSGNEITADMGNVRVIPQTSSSNERIMWGALYWQYFEDLDKISSHETPLQLKKKIFLEKITSTGPVILPVDSNTKLALGDKLKIRIELRVDRAMEYVQMKDMRSSGFEPINVLSGYKYQDGLGYYETTRDAATNFFFSYLPKGTYVFEYPLRVTHSGNFSNGITTIQSMYAPEFTSHSEGVRVVVAE